MGVAAVVTLSLVSGFAVMQTSGAVTDLTEEQMDDQAQAQANSLNADMREYQKVSSSIAASMEGYNRADASRQEVSDMLENLAQNSPDALGVYVAYEPNGFDGNDAAYTNGTGPGSNDAGRYAPYWSRFDGELSRSALNNLESQDWYTEPIRQEESIIKGPFVFDGEYMISFLTPIRHDGEVVGVAGVDVSIDYWQQQITQPGQGEDGYSFIVSQDGSVLAHPNESAVGQVSLAELGSQSDAPELEQMQEEIQTQDSGNFTMRDPVTGQESMVQYRSIETGDFVYATVVPERTAMAAATSLRNTLIGVSGASLFGLVGIIYVGGRRITNPIERLTERARAIEDGDYEVNLESGRSDEVGDLFGSLSSMRDSLVSNIDQAAQAKQEAESARQEAEQLSKQLEETAAGFSSTMGVAADGDLTQRMDATSQNNAMREIATSFNEMMSDLETTVTSIRALSSDVAVESTEIDTSAREVERAGEQVADSIQQIAAGTDDQVERLDNIADEMSELSGSIEEVAASAETVATKSQRATELSKEAAEAAEEAGDVVAGVEDSTSARIEQVESLAEEIGEIGEIAELISDIAEQTNILALNASIEAAHADGDGDGFGVVADEVKALAEETSDAADKITMLIDRIQRSAEETVTDMQSMGEQVQSGGSTVEEALETVEQVTEQIGEANAGVQQISDVTDQQAASTEEVVSMVDQAVSVTQEASEEAADVSAATEEQTSSLSEVTSTTQSVSELANKLNESVDVFSVGETSDGQSAASSQKTADRQVSDD
jgi:methyl-accepting chemotaxis protein